MKVYFFIPQRVKAFKIPSSTNDGKNNESINEINSNKSEKNVYFSMD